MGGGGLDLVRRPGAALGGVLRSLRERRAAGSMRWPKRARLALRDRARSATRERRESVSEASKKGKRVSARERRKIIARASAKQTRKACAPCVV